VERESGSLGVDTGLPSPVLGLHAPVLSSFQFPVLRTGNDDTHHIGDHEALTARGICVTEWC
jgi:hypothetical protein